MTRNLLLSLSHVHIASLYNRLRLAAEPQRQKEMKSSSYSSLYMYILCVCVCDLYIFICRHTHTWSTHRHSSRGLDICRHLSERSSRPAALTHHSGVSQGDDWSEWRGRHFKTRGWQAPRTENIWVETSQQKDTHTRALAQPKKKNVIYIYIERAK